MKLVPAPGALLGLLAVGLVAVLGLPGVADDLPHPGREEQAQYALTCLGLLVITCAYVYLVARAETRLDRTWILWTLTFAIGLLIVKFILSPTAYQKSTDTSLGEFVTSGLVVAPLYLAALGLMYWIAGRSKGSWSSASMLKVSAGLAIVAVSTRLAVALVLGTASEYLDSLLGTGLILPVIVAGASFAVMKSFDRAGPSLSSAFAVGIALVICQHVLWTVYMYRLF